MISPQELIQQVANFEQQKEQEIKKITEELNKLIKDFETELQKKFHLELENYQKQKEQEAKMELEKYQIQIDQEFNEKIKKLKDNSSKIKNDFLKMINTFAEDLLKLWL